MEGKILAFSYALLKAESGQVTILFKILPAAGINLKNLWKPFYVQLIKLENLDIRLRLCMARRISVYVEDGIVDLNLLPISNVDGEILESIDTVRRHVNLRYNDYATEVTACVKCNKCKNCKRLDRRCNTHKICRHKKVPLTNFYHMLNTIASGRQ
ncbi:hypothetical protein CcNV_105 [Crangon crangon nudivirus]|uniref:Uncharacterized protein n=1 Tax=Crangon crangon nudivirus TaxID=2880838 RepID=A0AAE9BZX7_9VIRU|nr:hypothetical protein QKT25_gp106 [Crangon crangon nudivirus]UBZ25590.1 hypothetical protein CcNV_105 [Crangon crangon nudivirus]